MSYRAQSVPSSNEVNNIGASHLSDGVYYLAIIAIFLILRFEVLPGLQTFNHSQLQMIFFPFVLVLLWRIRALALGIPVQVLLAVAVCGFISIWFVHNVFSSGYGSFHIARLSDDPYETQSRIFREGINNFFPWNDEVHGYRYWNSVLTRADADALIERDEDIRVLVWGNQKRIFLSFGASQSDSVASILGVESSAPLLSMELITRVPIVGMPFAPREAVREFIARLLSGLLPIRQNEVLISGAMGTRHELDLRTAARVVTNWRTEEHRGFAWWILGNYYVRKALADPSSRKGYFSCAARSYSVAAYYVKRRENPELFAAIHNNNAVLQLLMRFFGGGKAPLKNAQRSLIAALSAMDVVGSYQATPESFVSVKGNVRKFRQMKKRVKHKTKLRKKSAPKELQKRLNRKKRRGKK